MPPAPLALESSTIRPARPRDALWPRQGSPDSQAAPSEGCHGTYESSGTIAEELDRSRAREPVGHPAHVPDRGANRVPVVDYEVGSDRQRRRVSDVVFDKRP